MSNDYDKNEYNLDELKIIFETNVVQNILTTTLISEDHTYKNDHDLWNANTDTWNSYHIEVQKVGINRYDIQTVRIEEK